MFPLTKQGSLAEYDESIDISADAGLEGTCTDILVIFRLVWSKFPHVSSVACMDVKLGQWH
jgi:hypothetical protein